MKETLMRCWEFLQEIWNANSDQEYYAVGGVLLVVWLFKHFISRYFASLLFTIVHRIWKDVDRKSFVSLVVKPLGFFLAVLISIITLFRLNFPPPLDIVIYKYTLKQVIHSIGTVILIVSFISLLLRLIDFIALILEKKANLTADLSDNQLIVFFKDFFKVILVVIGVMLVLRFAFDLDVSGLLTGLSIVGAAIALALRESLENLIASFIIFFDKPFTAGDLLKVQQVTGTVEKIGLRSTRIRTEQKTFVTVPNKQMVDSVVDNLSLRTQRRGDLNLQVRQSATSTQLSDLIDAIRSYLQRKDILSHNVFFNDITLHAYNITVEYFTEPVSADDFNIIRQEINLYIIRLLEEKQLELASIPAEATVPRSAQP